MLVLCYYLLMPVPLSPEASREVVLDHAARLRSLPTFGEPTNEDYEAFAFHQAHSQEQNHFLGRGKRQVSIDLGLVMKDFEALFIGKSILDIGCGTGVLSEELARLKKTRVTALDHNPETLDRVPNAKNITKVLGSGYDLAAVLGDEKYDVIVSSFSSYFWANNEEERRASVNSPLGSCATGGRILFVPIVAEPGHKEQTRKAIASAEVARQALEPDAQAMLDKAISTIKVHDWLDVVGIDALMELEQQGIIDCTILSSRDNVKQLRMGPQGPVVERYSAIAHVLAA